jgi:gliding motility-associated-like protein
MHGIPSYTVECVKRFITLYIAADSPWRIQWSNGDTTNQTNFLNADTAGLVLTAEPNCIEEYFINLPTIPSENDLPMLNDTFTSIDHPLSIQLPLNENEWSVEWFPPELFSCHSCLTTNLSANQNIEISLTLTHEDGCVYIDSFFVYTEGKEPGFYFPNIFSPNGDGVNDIWHISYNPTKGNVESLEIFDRWGNMVHQVLESGALDWNGTYRGQSLSPGVYTYKLLFKPNGEALLKIWGNVTLIR